MPAKDNTPIIGEVYLDKVNSTWKIMSINIPNNTVTAMHYTQEGWVCCTNTSPLDYWQDIIKREAVNLIEDREDTIYAS